MHNFPSTRFSLLARIRDPRDDRAWAEFVAIYEPAIYGFARKQGLQNADAQDLCQDVLRAVAQAIDRWKPDPTLGSFRSWLFCIARNLLVNLVAGRKRRPLATGESGLRQLLEEHPAPLDQDSAIFDLECRRQLFRWAAESVRQEFTISTWQAFWRTAVEGHNPGAVAEELGLSVGAVYIARSRVTARLRTGIAQIEGREASN